MQESELNQKTLCLRFFCLLPFGPGPGTIKLPNVPRPRLKVCVLGDAVHCEQAQRANVPFKSVEVLLLFVAASPASCCFSLAYFFEKAVFVFWPLFYCFLYSDLTKGLEEAEQEQEDGEEVS